MVINISLQKCADLHGAKFPHLKISKQRSQFSIHFIIILAVASVIRIQIKSGQQSIKIVIFIRWCVVHRRIVGQEVELGGSKYCKGLSWSLWLLLLSLFVNRFCFV